MVCPNCGSRNLRVTDSIPDNEAYVFRSRKCGDCNLIFRTAESVIPEGSPLKYAYIEAAMEKQRRWKK